jgi:GAF domain-containing protein
MPWTEEWRQAELHRLDILVSAPRPGFDRIAKVAKRLFGCRAGVVSFVGSDTIWFNASDGTGSDHVPRGHSFSEVAVLSDDVTIVVDALADPRFAQTPYVAGPPGYRFFAGAPIRSPSGLRIGVVCVLDDRPRVFSEDDKACLQWLAAMARTELALREIERTQTATTRH